MLSSPVKEQCGPRVQVRVVGAVSAAVVGERPLSKAFVARENECNRFYSSVYV